MKIEIGSYWGRIAFGGPTGVLVCMTGLIASGNVYADQCSDILSRGIVNQYTLSRSESLRETFDSWMCNHDVGTHEEAMEAGIGLGVPVYGVPLKLEGTFESEERDEWKRSHCETRSTGHDESQSLRVQVSQVEGSIVAAWSACMQREAEARNRGGLSCRMRADEAQVMVSVAYRPIHSADSAIPVVVSGAPVVSGMRCASLEAQAPATTGLSRRQRRRAVPSAAFGAGSVLRIEEQTFVCTRQGANRDDGFRPVALFSLNTNRGSCSAQAAAVNDEPVIFEGTREITSNYTLHARRVIFRSGSVVRIRNGATFEIYARSVLVEGESALIDGHGEVGARGAEGASPGGTWNTNDRDHYDAANGACVNPGNFDRGGRGGVGGTGGGGATIIIHAPIRGPLLYNVEGGEGGPGGPPGSGRVHTIQGRDPWTCPNDGAGPQGGQGPRGEFLNPVVQ